MPMMRGIKFACEPCIRGHRSSKCNHSDRVLVQVRKPGRPLSSCPHTLSSSSPGAFVHSLPAGASGGNGTESSGETGGMNCSCDVTSVAIPKVASCACGTSKPHEPPPKPPALSIAPLSQSPASNTSQSTMITTPMSPTSPTITSVSSIITGSANKISKSQRPKKRDGPVRRGSVIVGEAALELLLGQERERSRSTESPKVENLGSSCEEVTGIPNGDGPVNGNGMQGFMPTFPATIGSGEDTNGFHLSQQFSHVQNGDVLPESSKQSPMANCGLVAKPAIAMEVNDILSPDIWNCDRGGPSSWQLPQNTAKKTSCGDCSGKSPQSAQPQIQQQYIHHTPMISNPQQSSSCCHGSNKTVPVQQQPLPAPQVPFSTPQFFPVPQYPPSYIPAPNFPQVPNTWMYSTINHPITHQEFAWLQQQRAAGLFGPQPAPQMPGHVSLSSPMVNNPLGNGWTHSCHCGPECNCLGCATHPFNRRTVEHVREIQSFMAGDSGGSSSHSHSNPHNHNHPRPLAQHLSQPQPHQNELEVTAITLSPTTSSPKGSSCNGNGTPAPAPAPSTCCGNESSHEAQQVSPPSEPEEETGADGTPGGMDTAGELSPNNFIYFDYPLGTCAQTETGCKCGEGCTCIGCITHGEHYRVELEGGTEGHTDWGAWGIGEGS